MAFDEQKAIDEARRVLAIKERLWQNSGFNSEWQKLADLQYLGEIAALAADISPAQRFGVLCTAVRKLVHLVGREPAHLILQALRHEADFPLLLKVRARPDRQYKPETQARRRRYSKALEDQRIAFAIAKQMAANPDLRIEEAAELAANIGTGIPRGITAIRAYRRHKASMEAQGLPFDFVGVQVTGAPRIRQSDLRRGGRPRKR